MRAMTVEGGAHRGSVPRRLLLDRNLGRLARWLRFLGYDTAWDRSAGPAELLAKARNEDRVLLTRDTLLVERRAVRRGVAHVILVRDDVLINQLRQLRSEEGLRRLSEARCMVCNGVLEPQTLEKVRGRVPPYVAQTQTRFTYCPTCDRIMWPATHWENMERGLAEAGFGTDAGYGADAGCGCERTVTATAKGDAEVTADTRGVQ